MKVIRYINSILTSNSYILDFEGDSGVWVVDPGDSIHILQWLERENKYLIGILITHSHFDHIYGVNDLHDLFPDIKIYASLFAKEGMLSAKLNSSYFTENPFVVKCDNIYITTENDRILLAANVYANVLYTPGHNRDCLSFQIEKNLFTGDALIPGIKVYTKLKHGDKTQAENSIRRIFEQFDDDVMLWPGHADNCLLGSIKYSRI